MPAVPFEYSNLSERPPGRLLSVMARLSPGVRAVQAQVVPFAREWRRANLAALERTGPIWVALGDSMTQGIGAPAFDQGWVGQLARRLDQEGHGHRVVNLSVSGARVLDVVESQLPALASLGVEPDLVTVMIGSNDMISPTHRKQVVAGFARLLGRLPAGTVINLLPQRGERDEAGQAVNALLLAAAAEHRIQPVRLGALDLRSWRGKLAADHFHPNELGYARLADGFATAITNRPALPQRADEAPPTSR